LTDILKYAWAQAAFAGLYVAITSIALFVCYKVIKRLWDERVEMEQRLVTIIESNHAADAKVAEALREQAAVNHAVLESLGPSVKRRSYTR
jgi:hypothetical protein